jgi:hypothetical protein
VNQERNTRKTEHVKDIQGFPHEHQQKLQSHKKWMAKLEIKPIISEEHKI